MRADRGARRILHAASDPAHDRRSSGSGPGLAPLGPPACIPGAPLPHHGEGGKRDDTTHSPLPTPSPDSHSRLSLLPHSRRPPTLPPTLAAYYMCDFPAPRPPHTPCCSPMQLPCAPTNTQLAAPPSMQLPRAPPHTLLLSSASFSPLRGAPMGRTGGEGALGDDHPSPSVAVQSSPLSAVQSSPFSAVQSSAVLKYTGDLLQLRDGGEANKQRFRSEVSLRGKGGEANRQRFRSEVSLRG